MKITVVPHSASRDTGWTEVLWRSAALGKEMSFSMRRPGPDAPSPYGWPVLYLLHGSGHDRGSVVQQVLPPDATVLDNALLVIPDGNQGWWLDSPQKPRSRYAQYFWELVEYIDHHYRTDARREGRGICGFSMGGYGAFHLAIQQPERVGSISSLLGTVDIAQMFPDYHRLWMLLGPNPAIWQLYNPIAHVQRLAHTRIWFCTSREGFERPQNERCKSALESVGAPFEFHEFPGAHETAFVHEHMVEALTFHRTTFDRAMHRSVESPQRR